MLVDWFWVLLVEEGNRGLVLFCREWLEVMAFQRLLVLLQAMAFCRG